MGGSRQICTRRDLGTEGKDVQVMEGAPGDVGAREPQEAQTFCAVKHKALSFAGPGKINNNKKKKVKTHLVTALRAG